MSDDSEAFASADEGFMEPEVKSNPTHPVIENTSCKLEKVQDIPKSNVTLDKVDVKVTNKGRKSEKRKPKAKHKASKSANRLSQESTESQLTKGNNSAVRECLTSHTEVSKKDASSLRNEVKNIEELPDVDVVRTDKVDVGPLSTCSAVSSEQSSINLVPEPELISQAASTFFRGLGDGFTTLTNVFQDVVNIKVSDCSNSENDGKGRPKETGDDWNSNWGDNDGWEVDNLSDSESHDTPSNLETIADRSFASVPFNDVHSIIEEDHLNKPKPTSTWDWIGVSSLAQQFTSSLQSTSLNIVNGGVDVLEMIGRKTMSVLAENDPGYECTKRILHPAQLQEKPNLSKIIHEARKEHSERILAKENALKQKRGDFVFQLDQTRALVHLEALELVGEQAESSLNIHLDSLTPDSSGIVDRLISPGGMLDSISDSLSLETKLNDSRYADLFNKDNTTDDVIVKRLDCLSDTNKEIWSNFICVAKELSVAYSYERVLSGIIDIWNTGMNANSDSPAEEIYYLAVSSLAKSVAVYYEYLHKLSECVLVQNSTGRRLDFVHLANCLSCLFHLVMQLQVTLCHEFNRKIKDIPPSDSIADHTESRPVSVSQLTTNLVLDCGNAENHIRNAARVMVPVFQLACVNSIIS